MKSGRRQLLKSLLLAPLVLRGGEPGGGKTARLQEETLYPYCDCGEAMAFATKNGIVITESPQAAPQNFTVECVNQYCPNVDIRYEVPTRKIKLIRYTPPL